MSAVDGIDEFAAQLAGILKEKNAAYGDSFARVPTILAMLYPSVPPEVLENILFTARILDKLGRIAQDPLAAGEDAYLDVAGYALLMANVQRLKRDIGLRLVPLGDLRRPRAGVMFVGDEAVRYDMPAEAPSEPNGRIKRDMANAEVTQEPTGWYIVCFEGRDRQFFNDFGGFWTHDIRDATSFLSREAAASCHIKRETYAVRVGSVDDRPDQRVSDDGWVVECGCMYLELARNAWVSYPDWATQFPSEEAAEVIAKKVRTGLIVAQKTNGERSSCE